MTMHEITQRLARGQPAVLVRVAATQGSVPRETGAWMAVFADAVLGSVGGGQLEWQAIAQARALLARPDAADGVGPESPPQRHALGPNLGQCCGGVVHLSYQRIGPPGGAEAIARLRATLTPPRHPLALFGGGHVGQALVRVLEGLPFEVLWIDSRDGIFPAAVPDNVRCEHSDPVEGAVQTLAPGSRVLVMSFSHAQDLDIVAACLARQRGAGDLAFIGLIGSQTKWARFRGRLVQRGFSGEELARVTCPIGLPGIVGKAPEVIAVATAAQLLQSLAQQ